MQGPGHPGGSKTVGPLRHGVLQQRGVQYPGHPEDEIPKMEEEFRPQRAEGVRRQ